MPVAGGTLQAPQSVSGNSFLGRTGHWPTAIELSDTGRVNLSLGERENRSTRFRQSRAPRVVAARDTVFPLPEGEGKGEGEPDVANQNGRRNLASTTRLAPRAGGLCYPKVNFRLPSNNDWRKPPRALVFRAFFPPHPGPLPWGEGESPAAWWRIERAASCGCLGLESRSVRCPWERRPS